MTNKEYGDPLVVGVVQLLSIVVSFAAVALLENFYHPDFYPGVLRPSVSLQYLEIRRNLEGGVHPTVAVQHPSIHAAATLRNIKSLNNIF